MTRPEEASTRHDDRPGHQASRRDPNDVQPDGTAQILADRDEISQPDSVEDDPQEFANSHRTVTGDLRLTEPGTPARG